MSKINHGRTRQEKKEAEKRSHFPRESPNHMASGMVIRTTGEDTSRTGPMILTKTLKETAAIPPTTKVLKELKQHSLMAHLDHSSAIATPMEPAMKEQGRLDDATTVGRSVIS